MKHTFLSILATTSFFCVILKGYSLSPDWQEPVNLDEMGQNFVLETKQLEIPGYPTACNPSIVRWGGRLLLSFDAYTGDNIAPDQMGLAWLDEGFHVIGTPHILPIRNTWQDPRLMVMANCLYIVFNGTIHSGTRRTFIARVHYDGVKLSTGTPECFTLFPGVREDLGERNWVPFVYCDRMLITYSIVPHKILEPLFGTQKCEDHSSTTSFFPWQWGTPRAGTGSLLNKDHYLAFFHSHKMMASIQSDRKSVDHYFMGAYTFECHPPFAVTAVSKAPIVDRSFYTGPEYRTVRPLRVIFPCGFVFDDHHIWVVYGKQDHEAWVAKLDKKGLYESLESVPINH